MARQSGPIGVSASGWGWRHHGRRAWAAQEITLRIDPGERVLLLGPSGAGKSTLLAGLAGVLGSDDDGEQAGLLAVGDLSPAARRGDVGLVLQDPDSQIVLERLGDDVAFAMENRSVPRAEIWRRVPEALEAVGLGRLALTHPTAALSGGQKQRLALAGAIAMRPGLLLLDEPTANLDPEGVAEVVSAVGRLVSERSTTLLVVEHRIDVWSDLVDRVVVLGRGGGIVSDSSARAFLSGARTGGPQRSALQEAGIWVPGAAPEVHGTRAVPRAGRTGEPLLHAEDLAVGWDRDSPIAGRIEFSAEAGRLVAVTGPNGAGKTTFALTLGGLLAPVSGSVRASNRLADGLRSDRPISWRSRDLLGRIGSVFQNPEHEFVAATVLDEIAAGPKAVGLAPDLIRSRVDEMLQRLRLDGLARANPYTLSGGEKRRLSVATVLVSAPHVVILDEPTFGQDAITWLELARMLDAVRAEGRAVVAVTHDAAFVSALADDEVRFAGSGVPAGSEAGGSQ